MLWPMDLSAATLLAQSTTGSSPIGLLLPIAMVAGMYFLLIRPQRRRQREQQQLLAQVGVGDDVMTIGGIYGRVVALQEDDGTIDLEIAPGVTVRMVRQGVRERIIPASAEDDATS